jgi:hypothetical protein
MLWSQFSWPFYVNFVISMPFSFSVRQTCTLAALFLWRESEQEVARTDLYRYRTLDLLSTIYLFLYMVWYLIQRQNLCIFSQWIRLYYGQLFAHLVILFFGSTIECRTTECQTAVRHSAVDPFFFCFQQAGSFVTEARPERIWQKLIDLETGAAKTGNCRNWSTKKLEQPPQPQIDFRIP